MKFRLASSNSFLKVNSPLTYQSYKKKNRARIALVVASLAVGALPAGMGFAGQEALRQALLGAAVVSTLPQLLSSVFDPLFDALERR